MSKNPPKNTIKPNNSINNTKNPSSINNTKNPNRDENILFDFGRFNFKSVKVGNFTNFVKNKEDFSQIIDYIFHEAIPDLQNKTFKIIESGDYNYHLIKKEQYKIAMQVIRKYNREYQEKLVDSNLIQFGGGKGSYRFVGIRSENVFQLLFIDVYHLLCPSIKYNNQDYNSNKFCLMNLDK